MKSLLYVLIPIILSSPSLSFAHPAGAAAGASAAMTAARNAREREAKKKKQQEFEKKLRELCSSYKHHRKDGKH